MWVTLYTDASFATMLGVLAILAAVGCGSTAPSRRVDVALERELTLARATLDAIVAARPEIPYQVSSVRRLGVTRRCSQGPFRIEVTALGAKYGERVGVFACTSVWFGGQVRVTVDSATAEVPYESFGHDEPNDHCMASVSELARLESAEDDPNTSIPQQDVTNPLQGVEGAPAILEHVQLEELARHDGDMIECPEGTHRTWIALKSFWTRRTGAAIEEGAVIRIEFWSRLPHDFESATIVVRHQVVDQALTLDRWLAVAEADDAWWERRDAAVNRWNAAVARHDAAIGARPFVQLSGDDAAAGPPPPQRPETQPPSPSVHAEWIPGYWHLSAARWVWIAGWWRVPEEDLLANLTVHAPEAPPPARDETEHQAEAVKPLPDAVWASGGWQWNGNAWVWVEGAWRIRPEPNATWRPSTWRVTPSGSVFLPGGWTVSIGR